MSRKSALIGAGIFTAMIAGVFLILTFSNEVKANDGLESPPPAAVVVENTTGAALGEFEAALAAREAALQVQVDQRQAVIATLDETYQDQFSALETQLEETNNQLTGATERVEALQKEAAGIQEGILAADQAFQEEMIGLQNGLTYEDSQMRLEIEAIYAQLQQAYDQIAAQEAQAQSRSGGGGGGSSSGSYEDGDHDDGEHDDHDDDHDDDQDDDEHDNHDGEEHDED